MEETMDTGVTVEELNCKACQNDITSEYFTELIENEEKLKKENAALKEQLKQNSLSQDSFKEDNDKILFYFALSILWKIYDSQKECLTPSWNF